MRPNILLLNCHDIGDHLPFYPGNSAIAPNLARFAAEGVIFDQYFAASPTCSPSRGTMLTGLMPHRNGLMALASGGHWEVRPEVPTLPAVLKTLGYHTACYGTWHISADFYDRGIDVGSQEDTPENSAESGIRYMRERDPNSPFFLMVGFNRPHRPYNVDWPELQDPEAITLPGYLPDDPIIRDEMVKFYSGVRRMDAAAGKVLDAAAELGLLEDTLIIYTSDHGIGMPLAKGTLYDPGLKIPLVLSWKGHIEGGRRFMGLTANCDLMPTILDAVGAAEAIPDPCDGHSLWPYAAAGEDVGHDYVYAEQTWHDFYEPLRSIRTDCWKLIHNYEPGPGLQLAADILNTPTVDVMRETLRSWERPEWEFYDLQNDPNERNNLSGAPEYAAIEAELRDKLQAYLEETDDPILSGMVKCPEGYWEHFCSKGAGPGGLPPETSGSRWLTVKWVGGVTEHTCKSSSRDWGIGKG